MYLLIADDEGLNEVGLPAMFIPHVASVTMRFVCACLLVLAAAWPTDVGAAPADPAEDEGGAEKRSDETVFWGDPVKGVRVGARISDKEIGPTSPLWVELTIENQSDQLVAMFRRTPAWDFTVHMTGPADEVTGETAYLKKFKSLSRDYGPRVMVHIKEGEAVSAWIDIRRFYDLTRNGEYRFRISRGFIYEHDDENKSATASTSELTVVVNEMLNPPPEVMHYQE